MRVSYQTIIIMIILTFLGCEAPQPSSSRSFFQKTKNKTIFQKAQQPPLKVLRTKSKITLASKASPAMQTQKNISVWEKFISVVPKGTGTNKVVRVVHKHLHHKLTHSWTLARNSSGTTYQTKVGKERTWYGSGQLREEVSYNKTGKKHGIWVMWFPSGKRKFKQTMFNGRLHGESIYWYPNGNIMKKGKYHHGKQVGEWFMKSSKGKLYWKRTFYKGRAKLNFKIEELIRKNNR